MPPGQFNHWSIRWLPVILTLAAAYALADTLAQFFVWHTGVVGLAANAVIAVILLGGAAASFWERSPRARQVGSLSG